MMNWRWQKASVNADILMKQGWIPGKSLGEELKRLRMKELDERSSKQPYRKK